MLFFFPGKNYGLSWAESHEDATGRLAPLHPESAPLMRCGDSLSLSFKCFAPSPSILAEAGDNEMSAEEATFISKGLVK